MSIGRNWLLAQPPDTLWTKIYGGTGHDRCFSSQQTSDGGYIIFGETTSYGAGGYDFYLIKTDSLGNTLWTRTYGGTGDDNARSGQQTSDGGYIVAGGTHSFGFDYQAYLIKTNENGDSTWAKTYGGDSIDTGQSIQQTSDGGYIIAGITHSFGTQDIYLLKTNPSGNILWATTFGDMSHDGGNSIQQTADGGYIIAGYTNSFGAGSFDVYLIKISPDTFGIEEKQTTNYDLNSVSLEFYPNPFSKEIVIGYALNTNYSIQNNEVRSAGSGAATHCTIPVISYIKIFDVTGKLVKQFDCPNSQSSSHIVWKGESNKGVQLPAGVYFVRLETQDKSITKKIVMLK